MTYMYSRRPGQPAPADRLKAAGAFGASDRNVHSVPTRPLAVGRSGVAIAEAQQ
jgi:hypothetical protein